MLISEWGVRGVQAAALTLLATGLLAASTSAQADGNTTVEEIVSILKDKGLIDEGQQQKLLARHEADQAKAQPSVGAKLMEGVEWSGDLRLRHETFWNDTNPSGVGSNNDDRYRFRYRGRLGFKKKINDWAKVGVRLAGGTGENDSTNRTLGQDDDFAPDSIFFDRAWAEFHFGGDGPVKTKVVAGKVGNPFIWKNGKDILLWDGDINPEGGYVKSSFKLADGAKAWATVGGFVVEERSSNSDGMMYAGQLGTEAKVSDGLKLGARGTLYFWQNLDASQQGRMTADGNVTPGTLDLNNRGIGDAKIGEVSAFAKLAAIEDWPVTFYGTFAQNFDADAFGVDGSEDTAYSAGVEVGSKKKFAKVGVAYFHAEANSVIAIFMDSDALDSHTNRKGIVAYGSRQLGDHVDFNLTYFDSEEIDSNSLGLLGPSLDGADRKRLQTDIVLKF